MRLGASMLHMVFPWLRAPTAVSVFSKTMRDQLDLRIEADNLDRCAVCSLHHLF